MLQRKERADRAVAAISDICQREKVTIVVSGFALDEGRLIPQIQVIPS